jgi:hypothetical protein
MLMPWRLRIELMRELSHATSSTALLIMVALLSTRLRYGIPWRAPAQAYAYKIRSLASRFPATLISTFFPQPFL